jgi:hypothetical protein
MAKILTFLEFLLIGALLGACGDTSSINLGYTVSGSTAPDLIVIMQANRDLTNYRQNIGPVETTSGSKFFYDDNVSLRQCAVTQGFIDQALNPSFLSTTEDAAKTGACGRFAASLSTNIFAGTSLQIANGLTVAQNYYLGEVSDGYLFVHQATPTAGASRCFHFYAAEVRAKNLVKSSGSLTLEDMVSLTTVPDASCFVYT